VNTKQKGDIAEAQVLAAFLKAGMSVLMPFGDRSRYDLVVEESGKFKRIQVKTGRVKGTSLIFNSYSVTSENGRVKHVNYRGQVDYFAVYNPSSGKIYMVPVHLCRDRDTRLSFTGDSRNQHKVLRASNFEFLPC
jgi:PD-(D/E)XK endonuclease